MSILHARHRVKVEAFEAKVEAFEAAARYAPLCAIVRLSDGLGSL